jgi:all-trans-retinol dehydrogenase (NAD+)
MIEANHGHIATSCSIAGFFGGRGDAPYCASKFGIRGLIETLRSEIRNHPLKPLINFTTIYPYFVHTPITEGLTIETA